MPLRRMGHQHVGARQRPRERLPARLHRRHASVRATGCLEPAKTKPTATTEPKPSATTCEFATAAAPQPTERLVPVE